MKRIYSIFVILLGLLAYGEGKVQWLETSFDFGAFGEDDTLEPAQFRFVNVGDEPVTIIYANATCGCTTPQYDRGAIAPGDTAVVYASFNPAGRPGRFSKQVYVRTTASGERQKLTLKGVVIGNDRTIDKRYPVDMGGLKLANGAVMMGRVPAGKGKNEFIDGYNQSANPITPTFANVPAYLQIKAAPETVPPGELVNFSVYFRGDKTKQWGVVNDSLQICPNGAEGPCYWLPVVAIIEEDFSDLTDEQRAKAPVFSLVGDKVTLDPVPLKSTKPVKGKIKIMNQGKSPLKIRRLYSPDAAVEVTANAMEIKPGKTTDLVVTFDPSNQPSGLINTRFMVICNDPSNPTRTIRVVAERTAE